MFGNVMTNQFLPPGGVAFSSCTNFELIIQTFLIKYINNAMNTLLTNIEYPKNVNENEHNESIINVINAYLKSLGDISLYNIEFLTWLLDTDTENMDDELIIFRNILRDALLQDITINIDYNSCSATSKKKKKIR